MPLPALATLNQFESLLGESLSEAAGSRALAVLTHASTRVRSYTRNNWVDAEGDLDGVPEVAETVTLMLAHRLWGNPQALKQLTTGPFSSTASAVGLELTDDEKAMLDGANTDRPFPGLAVITTTRGDVETSSIYVDVVGSDEPLPVSFFPS